MFKESSMSDAINDKKSHERFKNSRKRKCTLVNIKSKKLAAEVNVDDHDKEFFELLHCYERCHEEGSVTIATKLDNKNRRSKRSETQSSSFRNNGAIVSKSLFPDEYLNEDLESASLMQKTENFSVCKQSIACPTKLNKQNYRKVKSSKTERGYVTDKSNIVSEKLYTEININNKDSVFSTKLQNFHKSHTHKINALRLDKKNYKKSKISRKQNGFLRNNDMLSQRLSTEVNVKDSECCAPLQNIEISPTDKQGKPCALKLNKKNHRKFKMSERQRSTVTNRNMLSEKLWRGININNKDSELYTQLQNIKSSSPLKQNSTKLDKNNHIRGNRTRKQRGPITDKIEILSEMLCITVNVNDKDSNFSEPLEIIGYSPQHEQSSISKELDKENDGKCNVSKKRKSTVIEEDNTVLKRLCKTLNVNKDSELLQNIEHYLIHDKSNMPYAKKLDNKIKITGKISEKQISSVADDNIVTQKLGIEVNDNDVDLELFSNESGLDLSDELINYCQTNHYTKYLPYSLIGIMYQLDVSVLCLHRQFKFKHKYPLLSIACQGSQIDNFNDVVLYYENKSIHIHIIYIDKSTENDISYAKLFMKGKQNISINNYFDSFVTYEITESVNLPNDTEYLVIYTNAGLDLTEENELKQGQFKDFYPFKFNTINMDECFILKDFLFTNANEKRCNFYQFSLDKATSQELLKRLEFSSAVKKLLEEKELAQEFQNDVKVKFLHKLVFVVNQPNREELNTIIKNEMGNKVRNEFKKEILHNLTAPEKCKTLSYISVIIYEFNLLICFLHDMILHKNIYSINSERKMYDVHNDITIHYKDKFIYIRTLYANQNIGFSQLFPSKKLERSSIFSVNKCFALFLELRKDAKFFIIYTNTNLDLSEEKRLKKRQKNKDFYSLKFDSLDVQKKRYQILKHSLCVNVNSLYQFSKDRATRKKLLSLIKFPALLHKEKEEIISHENKKNIFINKLIFAVGQPNKKKLNNLTKNGIKKWNKTYKIPYKYEELHEIALRWSESHEFGPITESVIKKLLKDIKNNRSSYQEIGNKDINEEIKFAKRVSGAEGTYAFGQFLEFLIKGEGKKYMEVLKRNSFNLTNLTSLLHHTGIKAIKTFKELYHLWFDVEGNKTQYLKTLETEGINLSCMTSILGGAKASALTAFKELYDTWFDVEGNKSQYLKNLEENGVNIATVSCILHRAGGNASNIFKDLCNILFGVEGNKTNYLKTLEKEGISLNIMSSILHGSGAKAPETFKSLYDLWFDKKGNKSQYLKTLEEKRINLKQMSVFLSQSGANAPTAFKELYDLWFDEEVEKPQYLKTLEKQEINLRTMSGILGGGGSKPSIVFKNLYNLWFDVEGNKTQCLKVIEKEGVNLTTMSSILIGSRAKAPIAFKSLYDLWFDVNRNKTQYLETLKINGVNLSQISCILNNAGANAAKAFKNLYHLWFDVEGNKTQYLRTLEEKRINLKSISSILRGSGANAPRAFKNLYDILFGVRTNKTQYLKILEKEGIHLSSMTNILRGVGSKAPKAFKELYNIWFSTEGKKTQYLKSLEKEGINLSILSSILKGAGSAAPKAFIDLYNLWFDVEGNKTQYLITLKENGISLSSISCILNRAGVTSSKAFKDIYNLWFDVHGNKTHYLKTLEKERVNLLNMSYIFYGTGAKFSKAFQDLYDLWFDTEGNKTQYLKILEVNEITLTDISTMLYKAGANASKAFKDLYYLFFDVEGNKTHCLKTLEKEGINLNSASKILKNAGVNASKAFKDLYDLCFDVKGNKTKYVKTLEKKGINLINMYSILYGGSTKAAKAFKELFNTFFDEQHNTKQHLKHFIEKIDDQKMFTLHNLCDILSGAGSNAKDAFKKLHRVCFDDEGRRNELLNDFYGAGFKPSNLACLLNGTGVYAWSTLKKLHNECFNEKREKTKLLDDFYGAGFKPGDLCRLLSGRVSSLNQFHHFCFIGETQKYLHNLLREGFKPKHLCSILYGTKSNFFSAFKDFHDFLF